MPRALLVVDVQRDFCEGGSLAVAGGAAVARGITTYLGTAGSRYATVVASRDWHHADDSNGGHFAWGGAAPDFVATWPVHCVEGTGGASYHEALDVSLIEHHVEKGQGVPAYSMFQGVDPEGVTLQDLLLGQEIDAVDVVGIASDYCCLATARDALAAGLSVRVLTDLQAGVAAETTTAAYNELARLGATITTSGETS